MFKQGNTHHFKNPATYKRFKSASYTTGTTLATGTYGLTFANAAYNYMTFPNAGAMFPEGRPFTFEWYGELNDTNRSLSTISLVFSIGKQGDTKNAVAIQFSQGKIYLNIYDPTGTQKSFITTTAVVNAASNGMHRFGISYDRTASAVGNVLITMDGVNIATTTSGTGTGLTDVYTNTRFWIGANAWGTTILAANHYGGDIAKIHISPYARSSADMIRRQSDVSKLFPVDRYSMCDWDYQNGLRTRWKGINPSRKYV